MSLTFSMTCMVLSLASLGMSKRVREPTGAEKFRLPLNVIRVRTSNVGCNYHPCMVLGAYREYCPQKQQCGNKLFHYHDLIPLQKIAFKTEYIFVDVTGDIAVKLHVPLLLVFVLLAFTFAHQGRCGCEQSELLICSRFLEHIFGLDFYAKLSIFLQITKCQR